MARKTNITDRLFHRTWRPGHPFGPRLGRLRRWGMALFLLLLAGTISAYCYLSYPSRVNRICVEYLTQLIGGPVRIKEAHLSIFEGLTLDGVSVQVDNRHAEDSEIFTAASVRIEYDPTSLFRGTLLATRITATDPRLHLCENVQSNQWNYQRLSPPANTGEMTMLKPPNILLRNGRVDYSRLEDGSKVAVGSMGFDGWLGPGTGPSAFDFDLQSRDKSGAPGPVISGTANTSTGEVWGKFDNFELDSDIKAMLPSAVHRWWERHSLAGGVRFPLYHFKPGENGRPATYRAEMELTGVTLAIPPEEWTRAQTTERRRTIWNAFEALRTLGLNNAIPGAKTGCADWLQELIKAQPVTLARVNGRFVFTEEGIEIQRLTGSLEGNDLSIDGRLQGYGADAMAELTINAPRAFIPHQPNYVTSMPREVYEIYQRLHPEGTCAVTAHLVRAKAGQDMEVDGKVDIIDAQCVFERFPYPLTKARGQIIFGPDPVNPQAGDRVEIHDLHGFGPSSGPNANTPITINGLIQPLTDESGCTLRIEGQGISSEPALRAAFPRRIKKALESFDPDHQGLFPAFHGNFVCTVFRPIGLAQPWSTHLDLDIDDASGKFVEFPYPLEHLQAKLTVDDDRLEIVSATMHRGDATATLDGGVNFATGGRIIPLLHINVRNLPIDREFLAAIPADHAAWLSRIGAAGFLDIDGKISANERWTPSTGPANPDTSQESPVAFDFDVSVRNGVIKPTGSDFAVNSVTGKMRLTAANMTLSEFVGKHGDAALRGDGAINWGHQNPQIKLHVAATNLDLDEPLYKLLPTDARRAWDQIQPAGQLDVDIDYNHTVETSDYQLTLKPRKLDVALRILPYKLQDIGGTLTLNNDRVALQDMTARHGDARLGLSGKGTLGKQPNWELSLWGKKLAADDELRRTLPGPLAKLMGTLNLRGELDFDLTKLIWRDRSAANPSSSPPAASPPDGPDLDIAGTIRLAGASLDPGMPITDVAAVISLDTHVRDGALGEVRGKIAADSMNISSRLMRNFRTEIYKPADQDAMHLDKMSGELAGGEMAGAIDLAFPEKTPTHFGLTLVLRNADVRQITGDAEGKLRGQVNASLALEGACSDSSTRRGRGDVTVSGSELYQVPLILGLLRVTNLALPISSPFNEATARYSVDGNKVTFESIELRAPDMVMQGSGSMNFSTKKVKMSFVTDNPRWPKLPILGDLIQGAKDEMFQIHVNGTIEDLKVSGKVMNTFQTTIDEILKSAEKQK